MNKKMRITVISLLSVVFAVSVGFLVKDYCDSKMRAELYDNLIETVEGTDGNACKRFVAANDTEGENSSD